MKSNPCRLGQLGSTWLAFGLLMCLAGNACAHLQSTAFLTLKSEHAQLVGEWQLAIRDLEEVAGLDNNQDGVVTWGELRAQKEAVAAYALSRLHFRCGTNNSHIVLTDMLVDKHSDGAYAVLRFVVQNASATAPLEVEYQALFETDSKHRCLLRLQRGGSVQTTVFAPESSVQRFDLTGNDSNRISFGGFVKEGIWHIWSGYDHLLFLLALLLPGVLRRRAGAWEPVPDAKVAVLAVLRIITAFTLAHSITLSLATLGVVHIPERLIESAIAVSVLIAAMNNLAPFYSERAWIVAFGFGLLHGFGFANALIDLGLQTTQLAVTLFGFNLGVELGQLVIVGVFLPLALSFRSVVFYPAIVLRVGSAMIIVVSATWLTERVLNAKWLPF
jgi:hypothetical protein